MLVQQSKEDRDPLCLSTGYMEWLVGLLCLFNHLKCNNWGMNPDGSSWKILGCLLFMTPFVRFGGLKKSYINIMMHVNVKDDVRITMWLYFKL